LNIEFNLPEDIKGINIPPLILQPIVENAVKHNAKLVSLQLVITIAIHQGQLDVEIRDNGQGFPQQVINDGFSQGIGMKNLHQRVAQLKKGSIKLHNDNGAVVTLSMHYDD